MTEDTEQKQSHAEFSVGISCPNCGCGDTDVKDSRPTDAHKGAVRRRRACQKCDYRFTTYEISDAYMSNIEYMLGLKMAGKMLDTVIPGWRRYI